MAAPITVPFPTTSAPGELPGEGVGLLVNCMVQKNEDELSWTRTPGLRAFSNISPAVAGPRGALAIGTRLASAWAATLVLTDTAGASIASPVPLPGAQPVTMARNMRSPLPQVPIVTEVGAYLLDLATGEVGPYDDPEVGAPNSVSYFSGYFMFTYGDGKIVGSQLQNKDIEALSNTMADSNPDGLYRGISIGSSWLAMGPHSIEAYQDIGTSPFPLQRTDTIPVGLIAPWAVAGASDEWDRPLLFAASDYTVRQMNGFIPEIVSSKDVSLDIYGQRANPLALRAACFTQGENAFWVLNCPAWCWAFNLTTRSWVKLRSYGRDAWRVFHPQQFGDFWIGLDDELGQLVEITSDVFDECGAPLVADLYSGPLKQFPTNMRVPRISFDFTVGVGRITAPAALVDPSVMISWSHDGGATWANPLRRSLGRQGAYKALVAVNNLGRFSHHGLRLKWSVVDPVHMRFRGAVVDGAKPRRPGPVAPIGA